MTRHALQSMLLRIANKIEKVAAKYPRERQLLLSARELRNAAVKGIRT